MILIVQFMCFLFWQDAVTAKAKRRLSNRTVNACRPPFPPNFSFSSLFPHFPIPLSETLHRLALVNHRIVPAISFRHPIPRLILIPIYPHFIRFQVGQEVGKLKGRRKRIRIQSNNDSQRNFFGAGDRSRIFNKFPKLAM